MPANQSSGSDADGTANEPEAEHQSRAERRAAKSGKTVKIEPPPWSHGKVTGQRGPAPARKQYSSRRSGG